MQTEPQETENHMNAKWQWHQNKGKMPTHALCLTAHPTMKKIQNKNKTDKQQQQQKTSCTCPRQLNWGFTWRYEFLCQSDWMTGGGLIILWTMGNILNSLTFLKSIFFNIFIGELVSWQINMRKYSTKIQLPFMSGKLFPKVPRAFSKNSQNAVSYKRSHGGPLPYLRMSYLGADYIFYSADEQKCDHK